MTCLAGHRRVVASATCARCGQPLQAAGPLPDVGQAPAWLAPPFVDRTAATCRASGGPHVVHEGAGTCCACSASLVAQGDAQGRVWWAE